MTIFVKARIVRGVRYSRTSLKRSNDQHIWLQHQSYHTEDEQALLAMWYTMEQQCQRMATLASTGGWLISSAPVRKWKRWLTVYLKYRLHFQLHVLVTSPTGNETCCLASQPQPLKFQIRQIWFSCDMKAPTQISGYISGKKVSGPALHSCSWKLASHRWAMWWEVSTMTTYLWLWMRRVHSGPLAGSREPRSSSVIDAIPAKHSSISYHTGKCKEHACP